MEGNAMLNKKLLGAVMVAAVAVSSAAVADDRDFNTVAGAVVGAAIGHSTGGRNGAIVGGVIGAAVGNSIRTNDGYYNGGGYRGSYYQPAPQPVYYQQAPQPVYYQPAPQPVYYAPAPRYYGPPAVIYVQPRGFHHDHGRWEGRGGYGWRR
jgi:Glycine zipper 2TM domain